MTQQLYSWAYIFHRNENLLSCRNLYMIVHSSFIDNGHKLETTKRPPVDKWLNKVWKPLEYYSATKRNGLLIHTATWMSLKEIMLSEKSQPQKDTYGRIPCI